MVNFYKEEKKVQSAKAVEVKCTGLDMLGRGVCKSDEHIYFVEGLMPNECARVLPNKGAISTEDGLYFNASNQRLKAISATITKMLEPSSERRAPICPLVEQCGGCPLEHLPTDMALDAKVKGVSELLIKTVVQSTLAVQNSKVSQVHGSSKLGKNSAIKQALAKKQAAQKNALKQGDFFKKSAADAELVAKPAFICNSPELHYRRAARLAIRADHGKMHLGFRGAKTQKLVPIDNCPVLTARANSIIAPLTKVINTLAGKKQIGHVELLDSDHALGVLLRLTTFASDEDKAKLSAFAREQQCVLSIVEPYTQLDDSISLRETVLYPAIATADAASSDAASADADASVTHSGANAEGVSKDEGLNLMVKSKDCSLRCSPAAFVQVNGLINEAMIDKVIEAVEPREGMKVLDLFCGLGNFSLPLAKAKADVVGIDIVHTMVKGATANAELNGVSELAHFYMADLEEPFEAQLWAKQKYDCVVLDPGRKGAKRAVSYLSKMRPEKIIMISCNPLAAARDCETLIGANYKIQSWGAFDMFPRTTHLEIMLVLTRQNAKS